MSRLRFGPFVLDVNSRELCAGTRAIPLTPKAFQLLEILVSSRPKALSKFTLQERLWPDTFVQDKNLVNLIAEIRRALCDDPVHPRFVRTVHRFGYAFHAAATGASDDTGHRGSVRFRLQWGSGRAGLDDGEHVLGRDPDLLLFVDSPGVSRRHAVIRVAGESAIIEDLGSKNGTFVADRCVEAPMKLCDGDSIRIGSVQLTFTAVRASASTRTEHHFRPAD